MIQINTTNINILTLFSQGDFSLEELSLYLNLEKKSIYKNINSINSFLKDENLPLITLNEGIYSLKLSKSQWENLFRRKDFITSDEIVDYLYLKFIHNGFINLESEKERLNISRSSIIRYFNDIKKTLETNGSQYEYIVGRGLKLTFLSQTDKNIFSKKLIKFFIKCDFSLNHSIFIIDLIEDYNINKLLNHLYRIFKALNLPTTHFIISFLCSLNICIKVFGGFNFKKDYEYKDFSDIENIIKSNLKDYDALYQQQIFYFIISLKRDEINFEPSTLEKAFKTIEEVKEKFNLNNLNPFLEKMLLKKICFSIFKYENHIFKVKSSTITNKEKTLLNILDNILKKYNLNLFFCDKISIIQIIVKIIIEHNKDSLKNILLLFNEVIILDDNHLKDSLYNHNKKFNFHIEPTFFYKLNPENYENKYDLILSDEPSLNSKTIVVNSFNSMQVLSAIYGYIFDKALENFSYK
ncbi:MAG: hypothetical protein ACRDAG_09910 [Cetobacterium somerae]|uniref:hypothetical protein n=1 Tax=Cetobacterium sp. 2G large TaxID=2759680 RepID=UPI00163D2291|nr:hypothetical protein [Cetobacterium sp. 2G large]MBC2854149.1 hypothetical protein [Cetobacterium sp. 2G large]